MEAVLIKALSFLTMIAAGIFLRRAGLFKDGDDRILSKIILNFTLPAAVVGAFSNFRVEWSLIALVGLGVLMNLFLSGVGYFLARKGSKAEKAFGLLNYSGYNIGSFTMPYVQSFLGDAGMAITGLFDTGNALMCTGGTYAIASAVMGEEKPTLGSMAKKVFSS
ncbi:MAG: AEC family transporter, partial [Christensenellaceae bacterium]|nr:AEC family transporter [Christensenellaceae bacterium]